MKNRIILMFGIAILLICPIIVNASDLNFTDSITDEVGIGYSWDNEDKTLTLSGASFNTGIILPSNSTIIVTENTENVINTNSEIGISSSGKLTIRGKGSLSVNDLSYTYNAISGIDYLEVKETSITTSGSYGIQAKEKVTIENSKLKITGVKKGIWLMPEGSNVNDLSLDLKGVTGEISSETGEGIDMEGTKGNILLNIENSNDLNITGNLTDKSLSWGLYRSGIRLVASGDGGNAKVNINNSNNLYIAGSSAGISATCGQCGKSEASIKITNSSNVTAETITSTWTALFVSNSTKNAADTEGDAIIVIKDSKVNAYAPNDLGIMTSTSYGKSTISIENSKVNVQGYKVGIRASSDSGANSKINITENSALIIVNEIVNDGFNALSTKRNGKETNDLSGISENSRVIVPKNFYINNYQNGYWIIPDNGVLLVNNEEELYTYGGIIKENGEILPYNSIINNVEKYTDINDALKNAKENDLLEILIATGNENVILPNGVTLVSPKKISVKTDKYGFKIEETVQENKYVYKVVPAKKFTLKYYLNNKIIKEVEVYEQEIYTLGDVDLGEEDLYVSYFIINGEKHYLNEQIIINDNVDVEVKVSKIKNPNTSADSSLYKYFMCSVISMFGIIYILFKPLLKKKKLN